MASQRVALVTGASSGIGKATAELLAANGFTVFGTSRAPTTPAPSITWLPLDVRSDASVQGAIQSLIDQAGRLDVLVNNAGYVQLGGIEESSIADVQAQLETNLLGVVRMVKAALPLMRQQGNGHIINVSSVVGHVALPYGGLYATSKFALEGLTEALRGEVRPFGIAVSLIEPSFVKSQIASEQPTAPIAAYTPWREAALRSFSASLARGMEPQAVARAILRAATTKPRLRYAVGRDAKLLLLLKRVLPGSVFERFLRRVSAGGKPVTSPARRQPRGAATPA